MIQGDADPIVTLDAGKELAQSIPGVDFQVIARMGHDFSLKYVDEICSDIVENASKVKP